MSCCYILRSEKLRRFYIGVTSETVENRLERHLSKAHGTSTFTAKADDWVLFLAIPCSSMAHALLIERFVKRMKSSRFIQSLRDDPALVNDLVNRCTPKRSG